MTNLDHPTGNQDCDERDERASEREQQVDNLVQANTRSNDTMRDLVEKVRKESALQEKKVDLLQRGLDATRRLVYMVGTVLLLLIGIGVVNATNISNARRNTAVAAQTARDAEQTYALLHDCIDTQAGSCGKRNLARQKELLDEIKRYELIILHCARTNNPTTEDPESERWIACVNRLYPDGPQLKK